MKKKLLIALTTIFIGTLFFGTSIMAAQYEKLYYKVEDNEVTITGCLQSAESVVIPETIEGYPVTAIADKGFIYCRYLYSLVIPEGVRTIGKEAFYNCYLLNRITLPTTLTSIGANAFSDCVITTVNISSMDSWLNLTFGSRTSNPMHYSSNIRKPTLYLNGEPVTDVVIPEGVEEIKDYRFYNVSTLKSLTIPDTVKKIGDVIFYNCSEFKNVYISDIDAWCRIDFHREISNPLYHGASLYLNNEPVTNISISEGVETISGHAFYNCTSLESVTLPDTIKTIEDYAFYGCSNLKQINLPDSITNINTYALSGCSSLEHVVLPKNLTTLRNRIFDECTSLKSIVIPRTVTLIDYFIIPTMLVDVYYNGTKDEWNSITNRSSNCFEKATMHYFAYVNVLDKNGNVITNRMQDIGTSFDISSVNAPDGYKAFLFTDKEMTIPYNGEAINANQTLYAEFLSGTKTTLSEDGKILTVASITVESGKTVILAIYDGNRLLEAKPATYQGEPLTFITDKEYTNAKVMVWNNLKNLNPVCNVEIVK